MLSFFKRFFSEKIAQAVSLPIRDDLPTNKEDLGRMADHLLSDPLLQAAFDAVGKRHHRDWELAEPQDLDTQRTSHLSLLALRQVNMELRSYIHNAVLAQPTDGKYNVRVLQKAQIRK